MTFGGIGSNQTRDQISGWSFPWLFVFSAAARRLQVACEGRDSRIGRLGGRDANGAKMTLEETSELARSLAGEHQDSSR